MLVLKRAYEKAAPEDGVRFLVERLWPRGVKKSDLRIDAWLTDLASSKPLRRWFAHDPKKWSEFQRRYFVELVGQPSGRLRADSQRCTAWPGHTRLQCT